MSFYVPGISDFEERQAEKEKRKNEALDEIAYLWLSLSKDEKQGLIKAISQVGKEYKIKRLTDEQSKIAEELAELNK